MKKALAILGLLAILTALVPMAAEAGGHHGFHHGFHRGGRVFVGVGLGFPCCGFYPWPYYYPYAYPAYYPAPTAVYSSPAPATTYTQQAPQVDREVVFAEGRYLLQGDGVTTPYKWVWVPNPPPAPTAPPGPPPAATPQPR